TFHYREESDIRERLLKLLSLRKKRSASRAKTDAPKPEDYLAAYIEAQSSCAAYLKDNCGGDLAEEVSDRNQNQSSSCAEDKMLLSRGHEIDKRGVQFEKRGVNVTSMPPYLPHSMVA
ncbi:hypothetical protein DPMN_133229, partial [Dreissena polymorpha]